MGMGGTGGPTRAQILAEAKRQIRDLEGRMEVTQESITLLEKAAVPVQEIDLTDNTPSSSSRQARIERMLEAIIIVQLTTLRGHREEGNIKLTEMREGVARAESPIQTGHALPHPPAPRRF